MITEGAVLLQGRYRLLSQLYKTDDYSLWTAVDQGIDEVLVKVWPYQASKNGHRPSEAERALWDIELRHLFRITSSPEAESRLVTMRNAAVDTENRCFLLVMTAPGLVPLENLLQRRNDCEWLKEIRRSEVRKEIWRALRNIALGLDQIHDQQMIHGAISAASVFVHPQRGPRSMRLGGFEWTIRVASPNIIQQSGIEYLMPPELAEQTVSHSFETDWFCFGYLASRIFTPVTPDANSPQVRLEDVHAAIRASSYLDSEKTLLERLLDENPSTRLARSGDIVRNIDDVVSRLDQPRAIDEQSYLALAVILGPGKAVTTAICEEDDSISALDEESQRLLIENDLADPYVMRLPAGAYVLLGNRFQYWLVEYAPFGEQPSGTWDIAYCNDRAELGFSEDCIRLQLNQIPIKVFNAKDVVKRREQISRRAATWKPFLPTVEDSRSRRGRLELLHDFFRVTNQVELLFSDATIYQYEIVESSSSDTFDELVVKVSSRTPKATAFAARADRLVDYLDRERTDGSDAETVYLGSDASLFISEPPLLLYWTVKDFKAEDDTIVLRRAHTPDSVAPPQTGFLRTHGLLGQLKLISRRKDGIENLRTHYYLLRSLLFPDNVYINTGEDTLPLKIKSDAIDSAKRDAIHKIWQTRPIFALQGPPGTGKTTLVANLIGQIFEDDSMAQVLVTAQAHPAVDVLRRKVRNEVFGAFSPDNIPLSVRVNPQNKGDDEDTPERVARNIIERGIEKLSSKTISALQTRWLKRLAEMHDHFKRKEFGTGASDFIQLVKRSANITYCTSTAATLAALADAGQSFDWSIIEEAGKAHGFDLVLPLQLGHRWLLIGDHYQLRPYRYDDFKDAVKNLGKVFEQLRALPRAASRFSLVDWDLLRSWQALEETEKETRREAWLDWLTIFERLYKTCEDRLGASDQPGLSKMLDVQHRMHPTIAGMVSRSFYRDKIRNGEKVELNGMPTDDVRHPFDLPEGIAGRAILWVDVPPLNVSGRGNHTSDIEVEAVENVIRSLKVKPGSAKPVSTAILSPYLRQVRALNKRVRAICANSPPDWLDSRQALVHTVDSFQGNQAHLVIVSLVRNNRTLPSSLSRPLGFLDEHERINVMLSRSEKLLVLVGCWGFFARQLADTPADADQYIGFWRIAFDYLNECFENGLAIKMPMSAFGKQSAL